MRVQSQVPHRFASTTKLAVLVLSAWSSSCQFAKEHPEDALRAAKTLVKTAGLGNGGSGSHQEPAEAQAPSAAQSSSSGQGAQVAVREAASEVDAFQYDPVSRSRFVDLGEEDFEAAVHLHKQRRRQLAEAEDLVGCARTDARLEYLQLLKSRQAGRQRTRKQVERLERELSEAQHNGKDAEIGALQQQLDESNARVESSRHVPIKDLDASLDYGYGLFLLDLGALDASGLDRLLAQLKEKAGAYRERASSDRAKTAGQGQAQGPNQEKLMKRLALIRADEKFADEMASALSELARLIETNDLEGAQALADRKWAETCEV